MPLDIEHIFKSNKNVSRLIVMKVINNAIFNKFLLKIIYKIDKRKRDIKPTIKTVLEFKLFYEQLKKNLR
jgi:hypothetical protein